MRIKLREREDSAQFLLLTPPKTRTEHLIGRFHCNFKILILTASHVKIYQSS